MLIFSFCNIGDLAWWHWFATHIGGCFGLHYRFFRVNLSDLESLIVESLQPRTVGDHYFLL